MSGILGPQHVFVKYPAVAMVWRPCSGSGVRFGSIRARPTRRPILLYASHVLCCSFTTLHLYIHTYIHTHIHIIAESTLCVVFVAHLSGKEQARCKPVPKSLPERLPVSFFAPQNPGTTWETPKPLCHLSAALPPIRC